MFCVVERFYRQIGAVQWFRARRRRKKIDIVLSLGLGGKAAKAILRHVGRRVPEGQPDRAALKDSQGAVTHLKASWDFVGSIESHKGSYKSELPSFREV